MEKGQCKIIFWHKTYIITDFHFFVARFKTFGMQNGDMVHV